MSFFIDPTEVLALIQSNPDTDYCIVDLSSEASYLQGHIPGAVHLPPSALVCGQAPAPGKLPSKEQLMQVFSYLGTKPDTEFIVYDDEGGGWAGRFIWTLDVIGHKQYRYVDGGILAWREEGLAQEQKAQQRESTRFDFELHKEAIAEIPDILQGLSKPDFQVWDARSPLEYSGQRITAAKAGHIPGAINCEWTSLMDTDRGYRLKTDVEQILQNLGINNTQKIVTHCQSHHRSGFTYIVGKHLGFSIRGYHGSWAEWGNHPETPVEL